MYCKKCGKPINDNEKSCLNCGTEAARKYFPKYTLELYYCKSCGGEADKTDSFCRKCGAALNFSDIITENVTRRKEMNPTKSSRWMYIPFYPQTKHDETVSDDKEKSDEEKNAADTPISDSEASLKAEETEKTEDTEEAKAAEETEEAKEPKEAEEAKTADEPENIAPLTFGGEINITVTEEYSSPEEAEEPTYGEPAYVAESHEDVEKPRADEAPSDAAYEHARVRESEVKENPTDEGNAFVPFGPDFYEEKNKPTAENVPEEYEKAPAPEEDSENPNILLTGPVENADFVPPEKTLEENKPAENAPAEKALGESDGDPVNYSTADGETRGTISEKDASVNVTKPKNVPEKTAFGIIAIVMAVIFPPIGIILGIIAVARGWNTVNKTYVRLGIVAIGVGVAMTVAVSVLSWKIFIPAIEGYFKNIE